MSSKTEIEWTDSTWNPLRGTRGSWSCVKVSEGCLGKHCYAERLNRRRGGPAYTVGADALRVDEEALFLPLRWRRPRRVFACSMTDLFEERVPESWIDKIFAVMALARQHQFQVLTKRAERMCRLLAGSGLANRLFPMIAAIGKARKVHYAQGSYYLADWPLANVWLGVSAENQTRADERISWLLKTPAVVRFLSVEPLLGPVDLGQYLPGINLVIVGGESGGPPERALVHRTDVAKANGDWPYSWGPKPEAWTWVCSLRDQCVSAGTQFFFKQWGGPTAKSGGRLLDGREWNEMPGRR